MVFGLIQRGLKSFDIKIECHGVGCDVYDETFNFVVFHHKQCFVMHDGNVILNPNYANL